LRDLDLSLGEQKALKEKVNRRLSGEPVAYIIGSWEFYGFPIKVGPGVLIPRPETEAIVDFVKADYGSRQNLLFGDFGSGSGCLALALVKELNVKKVLAIEMSQQAFHYTKSNLSLIDAVKKEVLMSSVEAAALKIPSESLDFIVANPPYIAKGDVCVEPGVKLFEPHEALFSEEDGLAAIRSWIGVAAEKLKPGGHYYFEIGWKQESEVSFLVEKEQNLVLKGVEKDIMGHPRIVVCQKVEKHG